MEFWGKVGFVIPPGDCHELTPAPVHLSCAHQGPGIKRRTLCTVGRNFFSWPILQRNAMRFQRAKAKVNPTAHFFSVTIAVLRFSHHISKIPISKSSRISILSTPMFRMYPRVDQICLQIKKLGFLKIELPQVGVRRVYGLIGFPEP